MPPKTKPDPLTPPEPNSPKPEAEKPKTYDPAKVEVKIGDVTLKSFSEDGQSFEIDHSPLYEPAPDAPTSEAQGGDHGEAHAPLAIVAPETSSVSGHDLMARLRKATTADPELIATAQQYVDQFALSAPGDRLAGNVARELKRVKKLGQG